MTFSCRLVHIDMPVLADKQKLTFISSVETLDTMAYSDLMMIMNLDIEKHFFCVCRTVHLFHYSSQRKLIAPQKEKNVHKWISVIKRWHSSKPSLSISLPGSISKVWSGTTCSGSLQWMERSTKANFTAHATPFKRIKSTNKINENKPYVKSKNRAIISDP